MAAIKSKFQFLRENTQLIYGLVLIIAIPLAVIFNTLMLNKIFKEVIDRELYNKAITIGEVINAGTERVLTQPAELQLKLDAMAKLNNEVATAEILAPEGSEFKILASTDKQRVGATSTDLENTIAWHQDQPVAYLTATLKNGNGLFKLPDGRYWAVIMPLADQFGNKQAVLSLKVSLNVMDELTKQVLWQSYMILAAVIVVIILLLANNTRIFEYVTLYQKLKEVDQMKDEFISIASHELRAPVTGIRGYADMILDGTYGEVPEKVRQPIKTIEQATIRLHTLVEDLLNVSRIEQGRLKIELKPVSIKTVIEEACNEMAASAKEKGLKLEFRPHKADLPELNLDASRFSEVVTNLVSNAIKYSKEGGVEIITEEKDGQMMIRFKDSGIGMSAKERERLFQKFYRVQNDNTKGIIGTGLGLWITKSMVEMMRGQITVDSIEGVGTQFTLSFPLIKK